MTTNLYKQADSNIRKTWFLITGFFVLITLLGFAFSYAYDAPWVLILAVLISSLMSFVSYWNSDKIVLNLYKAKLIEKSDNPELYRLVENLCITAGIPLPTIFIIPEKQPNAFATGRDENHAVLAFTEGLLERLEKVELEGVVAHEISHIKNRDTLIQTVVVVLVGVISILANIFLRISFFGGRSSDDNRGKIGAILMLLGLVAAIIAPIAASLLKLSISRKREYLADASAALLTRYPNGLARALLKISADPTPMRRKSTASAHLFISSPFKGKDQKRWFNKLFLTHPPIEDRIRALQGMEI